MNNPWTIHLLIGIYLYFGIGSTFFLLMEEHPEFEEMENKNFIRYLWPIIVAINMGVDLYYFIQGRLLRPIQSKIGKITKRRNK